MISITKEGFIFTDRDVYKITAALMESGCGLWPMEDGRFIVLGVNPELFYIVYSDNKPIYAFIHRVFVTKPCDCARFACANDAFYNALPKIRECVTIDDPAVAVLDVLSSLKDEEGGLQ